MSSSNYLNVLEQLQSHGLIVDRLQFGRIIRTRVSDGDREKRGWYILHEVLNPGRDTLIFGSYGIYRGDDNGKINISYDKSSFDADEIAAFKKRLADDAKKEASKRKQEIEKASRRAEKVWKKLAVDGHCGYLDRKKIRPFNSRFTDSGVMALAMHDINNRIKGIQFIFDRDKHKDQIEKNDGKDKRFWPPGVQKKSTFNTIGTISQICLICEGFATGATLHTATNLPVVVCWDANNIDPVLEQLQKRYPKTKFLICADDDRYSTCIECQKKIDLVTDPTSCPHCRKPHKKNNAGISRADLNVIKYGVQRIIPKFADESARFQHFLSNKGKLSDFNDVQLIDGLYSVNDQINARLRELKWVADDNARADYKQGGGENEKQPFKPFDTVDQLLERFSLVYGRGGTLFDHHEHILVTLSDMRDACMSRDIHRRWQESPDRSIVRSENVGFDPAGTDELITCNLWSGWPTAPQAGKCDALLELLEYMCAGESGSVTTKELYKWVLCWLAYPIQNPGAKMKTTLVVHGPQGTGKNLFFDTICAIYGRYGRTIDQTAIEDKFNDWASGKLFLIADEVVARSDLYHVKNKLKHFITGDTIRINPKNMAAYEETNHVNVLFLSNERLPVVLEEDDRRHAVIWTPEKLSEEFYKEVAAEIKNGGGPALHDYLLQMDLSGFSEHSKPPMTSAKRELIELSKDSIVRFYQEWESGDIDGIKLMPALSEDIYELYKTWCVRQGLRSAPLNKLIDSIITRRHAKKERKRYMNGVHVTHPKTFIFPKNCIEMNPGNSEQGWLGQCVEQFRQQLGDYRGQNYG